VPLGARAARGASDESDERCCDLPLTVTAKRASGMTIKPAQLGGYVPLALQPDWVLERYYGWSVLDHESCLKLLERRIGPVVRHLILTRGAPLDAVERLSSRHRLFHFLGIVSLNDFSGSENVPRMVAGRAMRQVNSARWFGVGTFVLDLRETEETLWNRITSRERSQCRSARDRGVRVVLQDRPSSEDLSEFLCLYEPVAWERNLERPTMAKLEAIASTGALTLARCASGSGAVKIVNLIYRAHDQGYLLFSAKSHEVPAGTGRLVHWETARDLKHRGYHFYDLGLVGSQDPRDGVFLFKRSLGGTFVSAGAEFEWVSPLLGPMRKLVAHWHGPSPANR